MTDGVGFVVLEPGPLEDLRRTSKVPRLTLEVALTPAAGGERRAIELEVSPAGVGAVVDVLHRVGGEALVAELRAALRNTFQDGSFEQSKVASTAIELVADEVVVLRQEALAHLVAVDAAARQLFEHDLSLAEIALRPVSFGIWVGDEGDPRAATSGPDLDNYKAVRAQIAELDRLRRNVRAWSFTIPPNAHNARRQFESTVLGPYTAALRDTAHRWPAMLVMAPRLLEELADESAADIQRWAAGDATATPLDEMIQSTLVEAYRDLVEQQPDFRARMLEAADAAVRDALQAPDVAWATSPSSIVGSRHPLWAHPFLIRAAMEHQGLRPGDHGYAVISDSLQAAARAHLEAKTQSADNARMLGWASLGFGVLTLVPVVGQLALVAMITVTAVQTVEHAVDYSNALEASQALAHQARRYDVPEPDATGLICDLLALTADAALPAVGKVLSATVLRPANRAIAAARVKTVLDLGEHATGVAELVLDANAAETARELERLGLLEVERGR